MNKRTHRTTRTGKLDPELVDAYRRYPAVAVATWALALADFLAHVALFEALGDARTAAAAERAWWRDAVVLAAAPASCADEARSKVAALQPALDGRAWRTAREGHRTAATMIATGVEAERTRWGLATPTRH